MRSIFYAVASISCEMMMRHTKVQQEKLVLLGTRMMVVVRLHVMAEWCGSRMQHGRRRGAGEAWWRRHRGFSGRAQS